MGSNLKSEVLALAPLLECECCHEQMLGSERIDHYGTMSRSRQGYKCNITKLWKVCPDCHEDNLNPTIGRFRSFIMPVIKDVWDNCLSLAIGDLVAVQPMQNVEQGITVPLDIMVTTDCGDADTYIVERVQDAFVLQHKEPDHPEPEKEVVVHQWLEYKI